MGRVTAAAGEAQAGGANIARLWEELFPKATRPDKLLHLPRCAQKLKVFTYNLSFPSIEFENRTVPSSQSLLLQMMEHHRGSANCDWARSPCVETTSSNTGKGDDYSNLRQYAAEVPLLAKLLSLPQTRQAEEADLFVVPYFAGESDREIRATAHTYGVRSLLRREHSTTLAV